MAPTTTVLATSPNPATFAAPVTLTATIAPSAATGTVVFSDSGIPLGTGNLSNGVASFSTSALSSGPHYLTAVYGGDLNYSTSTSATVTQQVNPPQTQTGLPEITVSDMETKDPSRLNRTIQLLSQQTYAAQGKTANSNGIPEITQSDMDNGDPSRLNRTFQLLATQIQGSQAAGLEIMNGLPKITPADMQNNDPQTINRVLQLLAGQIRTLK